MLPPQPGGPPPLVRPDGTGEPSQQDLDQAFPPQQQPQQRPLPPPQPRPQDPLAPRPEATEPRPHAA
jgi:penicillin-binding protein 1A